MKDMFPQAGSFDQDITGWSTPAVTKLGDGLMFFNAFAFHDKFERMGRIGGPDDGPPSLWKPK
jgi:hypothetical protein